MSIASRNIAAPDRVIIRRALLSVFDKTGLVELARTLAERGVELVSTGGSAKSMRDAGLTVRDVSELTDFPEIMDGRVKTLHPGVHGGLLAIRDADDHIEEMEAEGIVTIDLLVSNLYPFAQVMAGGGAPHEIVENIDIGGPAMLRAAAKNHAYVTVLTDPADYAGFLDAMENGEIDLVTRTRLAASAFARVAAYDAAVSGWMMRDTPVAERPAFSAGGTLLSAMRYGENPHQAAALFATGDPRPGVVSARQVQGKALSFNNINDTNAAFELACEFPADTPTVAIIKHANPCGVASASTFEAAHAAALACDTTSAFGGIVALNGRLDEATARAIGEVFTEVVIAPEADDAALAVLATKKNLRVLLTGGLANPRSGGLDVRTVAGGLLVQDRDGGNVDDVELRVVTRRAPSEAEMADLKFAFRVAKHVKSNAIVYVKDGATVGVGAGQMSRVDSARIAARKAVDAAEGGAPKTVGSVVASDAFFPFADGLETAVEAGATAVIQPGGSMRDDEVIAAADAAGLAMVMTGMRHFRH
ncbi:bifunctional phosphoribosylaminoimidazolecarboxamide formyltransferase/IMP cyclohydrolase [Rhizobiaceae bacterium]|nr:bifunctional phosphoribosylaminoimidazolecarboxamide formyltransferase/IMP cyclohydrolase [Rhizobiaceae bacterium]